MKLFLIFPISLVVLFLIFCLRVIKRQWIEKRGVSGGTEIVSKSVYEKFLTKQQRQGIKHIQRMQDISLEDEDGGKPQDEN